MESPASTPPPTPTPITATLDWPGHTPSCRSTTSAAPGARGPSISTSSPRATLSDNGDPCAAPQRAERWGGGRWGAEPAELGAGRAGRGGPGRAPPRARKSRPRALGKCGRGACALQPAPAPRRSGWTSERAGRRLRRERLGSAAGECARAAPRTAALPLRPGARGLCGAGASETGAQIRAPRTPAAGSTWTLGRGGTGFRPRAWGRGRCKRVPLFLQLKAWGSDCSKLGGGGRKNPGFRVSRPPFSLVGRGRGGTPVLPPPPPRWIWQPLIPASRRGGAAPPARADRGLLAPASRQNAQEDLLPSDLSPAAAVHAPSAARVGPRTTWPLPPPPRLWVADPQAVVTGTGVLEQAPRSPGNLLHPSMPTPPEAEKQQTGPEEADQPPSMSSHDAAPPAPPRRNPCCLCWCCCCSCSWNEERRRAWRASRESRLQPLPSCEVCATPTPTPEEVRSWAQSFDKLMHSPAGRSVFREFLRTEYSEENMLFWLACEELKAEANQHVVDEKARLIYEDYVSILSPKEVSLDSRVREGINKKMQEPSAHTFDDAQLQIYTLMHRDSYPRFLSSPAYRALLLQGASQSSSEA